MRDITFVLAQDHFRIQIQTVRIELDDHNNLLLPWYKLSGPSYTSVLTDLLRVMQHLNLLIQHIDRVALVCLPHGPFLGIIPTAVGGLLRSSRQAMNRSSP